MPKCPSCKAKVEPSWKACGECGAKLKSRPSSPASDRARSPKRTKREGPATEAGGGSSKNLIPAAASASPSPLAGTSGGRVQTHVWAEAKRNSQYEHLMSAEGVKENGLPRQGDWIWMGVGTTCAVILLPVIAGIGIFILLAAIGGTFFDEFNVGTLLITLFVGLIFFCVLRHWVRVIKGTLDVALTTTTPRLAEFGNTTIVTLQNSTNMGQFGGAHGGVRNVTASVWLEFEDGTEKLFYSFRAAPLPGSPGDIGVSYLRKDRMINFIPLIDTFARA